MIFEQKITSMKRGWEMVVRGSKRERVGKKEIEIETAERQREREELECSDRVRKWLSF